MQKADYKGCWETVAEAQVCSENMGLDTVEDAADFRMMVLFLESSVRTFVAEV